MNSFYTQEELARINLKNLGGGVLISKKVSIYNPEKISIGNHVRIDDFCILSGNIEIGNYVHIAAAVLLFAGDEGIRIQDFAGISSRSAIYAASDDYSGHALTNPTVPENYRNVTGGPVTLERHALIGTGCTILPNVTIGEGTSVGSMSLVKASLPPWGIYVGIPCRYVKERSKDVLVLEKQLLAAES